MEEMEKMYSEATDKFSSGKEFDRFITIAI